ncbi:aconitase [Mobilisporobacter senegalensis]|uniref:Aconitate hydratase n=1 Tax=Mobilisporobacter senegalensis TaxID=1329262 RepID=A0A3N1XI16_9FIRM|nr:aconitate hydratase AcnA [Mobilisporobacter senegalensis]ROR26386.1 aconitase [Mobilisporobacter senegalensis]
MYQGIKGKALKQLQIDNRIYDYYSILSLQEEGYDIKHLPYSIRILLESVLRQCDNYIITEEHIRNLANWNNFENLEAEVPFKPARVILQDFTGVPAVVDLASMRLAMEKVNGNINKINPEVPVDLVIDHSVQVDEYISKNALKDNIKIEFERNMERYQFLNWAKEVFANFNVVPPATGIVHQVNLEYLAKVVIEKSEKDRTVIYPDTLVGTDSHTTMINGLGVLGWGVGGIEAEAGMLGQPSYFPIPEVIGVRITGSLNTGVNATDLALHITKVLRGRGVVGKFIEYFGEGVNQLSLADRATVANMAPEYGATCGFFPVDEETLNYLELTGRSKEHISLVEKYLKENYMFYDKNQEEPNYSEIIEIDLNEIETSLSGPKRPQDLIPLSRMKKEFVKSVTTALGNQGHGLSEEEFEKEVTIQLPDGRSSTMRTGSIAIAAITSCTNTSNPTVMIGAGLLARNAVLKGLKVPAHVKTSLAPGSKVVTGYLKEAGLLEYLEHLGFHIVGYGCTTCIGNSGPLLPEISKEIIENDLLVTSILSGNRNFEGRIHQLVKANYLASPILVVAYAIAGTMNIDLLKEPLGVNDSKEPVYLKDIWPSSNEISREVIKSVKPELFKNEYKTVYEDNSLWNSIKVEKNELYEFDRESTYIQNPTFFAHMSKEPGKIKPISGIRVVGKFGDSITTDHISPAGSIGKNTPAGKYLMEHGINPENFNTYGSRRGNHEIMMRGTFANIRIRNQLAPGIDGGYTTYWPENEVMPIYDACMKYKENNTGLAILSGKDYGMGSSRDWAAKGPSLLGIKIVIAESYERIHRSNLVMMGILPLQFIDGDTPESLGLTGEEILSVDIDESVKPFDKVLVTASLNGNITKFNCRVRFDSIIDIDYYRHGGILQMVLRDKLKSDLNP